MDFFNKTSWNNSLTGKGRTDAPLIFVGDFTSRLDLNAQRALSGIGYSSFEMLMHQASILSSDVYFTNVFKTFVVNKGELWSFTKRRETDKAKESLEELERELLGLSGEMIVAFGETAFGCLTGENGFSRKRGYIFPCSMVPNKKVIGTYHPMSLLRGQTHLKSVLGADLRKAKAEEKQKGLVRPERTLIYKHSTVLEALDWLDFFYEQSIVGFDIEVTNLEVSCISFSSSPELACVIPIANSWTTEEEMLIWRAIQKVLGNPQSIKVVQNGMFDIPFLAKKNGVIVRGPIHDTMIAHSIMYPDLPKGLGFLGSLYCGAQEYWKGMVSFKDQKREDG